MQVSNIKLLRNIKDFLLMNEIRDEDMREKLKILPSINEVESYRTINITII